MTGQVCLFLSSACNVHSPDVTEGPVKAVLTFKCDSHTVSVDYRPMVICRQQERSPVLRMGCRGLGRKKSHCSFYRMQLVGTGSQKPTQAYLTFLPWKACIVPTNINSSPTKLTLSHLTIWPKWTTSWNWCFFIPQMILDKILYPQIFFKIGFSSHGPQSHECSIHIEDSHCVYFQVETSGPRKTNHWPIY